MFNWFDFTLSITASIAAYYICKWLDSKDNRDD